VAEDEGVVEVVMTPAMFEEFKDWLTRTNRTVFRIPYLEGELPTYGVSERRRSKT
jgi:hypothetical protein